MAYVSDERLKKDFQNIENALAKVNTLRAVTFYQNELADKLLNIKRPERQVGVIAQDLQKVLPEVVKPAPFDTYTDENGEKHNISGEYYVTVQYDKIVPLLIAAIKELTQEINKLKNSN